MKFLKDTVRQQEKQIKLLEDKVAILERKHAQNNQEEEEEEE